MSLSLPGHSHPDFSHLLIWCTYASYKWIHMSKDKVLYVETTKHYYNIFDYRRYVSSTESLLSHFQFHWATLCLRSCKGKTNTLKDLTTPCRARFYMHIGLSTFNWVDAVLQSLLDLIKGLKVGDVKHFWWIGCNGLQLCFCIIIIKSSSNLGEG